MELPQPADRELTAVSERGRHQIVLAAEMLIERTFGDTGARRDVIHRDAQEALPPEQSIGGVENALTRLRPGTPHQGLLQVYR